MQDRERAVRHAMERRAGGASGDEIINWLGTETDASVIDAIYVVRVALDVSLGEAKRVVTAHPAWRERAEASAVIQDDAIRALEDDETN